MLSEELGSVNRTVPLANGQILIGGKFWEANGEAQVSIARLNSDGTVDPTFGPVRISSSSDPGTVQDIKVQSDGKIIVVGNFRQINGQNRDGIARLNSDGSLDTTFRDGLTGLNAQTAYDVELQSDSKIIVVGNFSTVGGTSSRFIVRLSPVDGSVDSSFTVPTLSSSLYSVAIQTDDKIVIGGAFTQVNLVDRRKVARLNSDGSLDGTFAPVAIQGTNSNVYSVSLQSDGKVLIAGEFSQINGSSRNGLARLNNDGSLDQSFLNGLSGVDQLPIFLAELPSGKILLGGHFSAVNGTPRNRIARLNSDGSLDMSFNATLPNAPSATLGDYPAFAASASSIGNGKLLIAGSFQSVGGAFRAHVARVHEDGSLDTDFKYVFLDKPATVMKVRRQSDGQVLMTGTFRYVNGLFRPRLTRVHSNGATDTSFSFPQGSSIHPTQSIQDIVLAHDGKIFIAGNFSTFEIDKLERLNADGTTDNTFQFTSDAGIITSIYLQPDGKVVIGGGFNFINNQPRTGCARLNANGSLDETFMNGLAGVNSGVLSIDMQPDGKILIGGNFSQVNGVNRRSIARLNEDGTVDPGFIADTNVGGTGPLVRKVKLQSDGKVVVTGNFTFINNVSRNRVARLNTNGSVDSSFMNGLSGANAAVHDMILQPDNKIIFGGEFSTFNGSVRRIVRANPDGSIDLSLREIPFVYSSISIIESLAADPQKGAFIGGWFRKADGFARSGAARLILRSTLFDYDGDGRADLSVRRSADNVWHLLRATAGYTAMQFGETGDRMTPSDYDGDGKTDVSVFRPSTGTWFMFMSQSQTFQAFGWGQVGDLPVPTDRDNDGRTDLVIFRPSNNTWYTRFANGTFHEAVFGEAGDKPVVGDFDADGIGDIALFRPSNNNWYIVKSSLGYFVQTWGVTGDVPVAADFDGDGATDHAMFRPSTGEWYLSQTTAGFSVKTWGVASDIPVPADYDGDGKTDVAVFRPSEGNWYILNSTAGIQIQQFGETGDVPTQSAFLY